jgi:hypothetical protein
MDSRRLGPEHPRTAFSYVLMGNIFEATATGADGADLVRADSFYAKFVQVWYKFYRREMKSTAPQLDSLQARIMCQEALIYLEKIHEAWQARFKRDLPKRVVQPMIQATYLLTSFYHLFGSETDRDEQLSFLLQLLEQHYGYDHPKTIKIEEVLRIHFKNDQRLAQHNSDDTPEEN